MRMKRMMPLVFAAVVGCVHGGANGEAKPARVAEADVGRLGPEQVGPVDQARQSLASARDALSRTSLKLQQAQNEEGIAKAEQQAAAADQKVADAQQKVANDSREPQALERARRLQEQAEANEQIADLHADYAGKLVEQRKAEMQAAEQQVKVAEARVEWSKLQALQQVQNPASTKYDAGRFETAVNDAQGQFEKAARHATSLELQATEARQRWEDAERRLQADRGGSLETGTGSGR